MGQGLDLGAGIGPGVGQGFMTPFGTNVALDASIPGRFYDFKQISRGKPVEDYQIGGKDFDDRVRAIQKAGYRESAFRKFSQAPETLYLTQIAVPYSPANSGPEFFNVADKVKPAGWFVHYQGEVTVNRDITFRFIGTGDDYIGVFAKGRPRMISSWGLSPRSGEAIFSGTMCQFSM